MKEEFYSFRHTLIFKMENDMRSTYLIGPLWIISYWKECRRGRKCVVNIFFNEIAGQWKQ